MATVVVVVFANIASKLHRPFFPLEIFNTSRYLLYAVTSSDGNKQDDVIGIPLVRKFSL